MSRNIFADLEVFAPEEVKTVPARQETLTKKQQNSVKQNLRESYSTKVEKPSQPNKQGSKTLRNNKDERQPHHEKDLNKRSKKPHGQNEVQEEMRQEIDEAEQETESHNAQEQ